MNPRSCVPVLFFSFSTRKVIWIAASFNLLSFVYSYRYHRLPGKKPLVHHPELDVTRAPEASIVLGRRSGLSFITPAIRVYCFAEKARDSSIILFKDLSLLQEERITDTAEAIITNLFFIPGQDLKINLN